MKSANVTLQDAHATAHAAVIAIWQGGSVPGAHSSQSGEPTDGEVKAGMKDKLHMMRDDVALDPSDDNEGRTFEEASGCNAKSPSRNRKIFFIVLAVAVVGAIAGGIGAAVANASGSGSNAGSNDKGEEVGEEANMECLHDLGEEFRGLVESREASIDNWPEMQYELTGVDFCTNHGFFSPLCQSTELLRSRGLSYSDGSWRFEDEVLLEYSHDGNDNVVAELTVRHSHDALRNGRLLHVRTVVDLEAGCVVDFQRSELALPPLTGTRTFLDGDNPNITVKEARPAQRHRCSDKMSVERSEAVSTLVWYFEHNPLSLVLFVGDAWIINTPTRAGHYTIEVADADTPEEPCQPSTFEHICGPAVTGALGFVMLSAPLLELDPAKNDLARVKSAAGDPECSKAWTPPIELREDVVNPAGATDATTPEQRACVQACVNLALSKRTVEALSTGELDACGKTCLPNGPTVELSEEDGSALRRKARRVLERDNEMGGDGTTRQSAAHPTGRDNAHQVQEQAEKTTITTSPSSRDKKTSWGLRKTSTLKPIPSFSSGHRRLDLVAGLRDEENNPNPICTKEDAGISFSDIHEWATVPPEIIETLFRPECSDLDFLETVTRVVDFAGRIPPNKTSTNKFGEVEESFKGGRVSLGRLIEGIGDVEHLAGWTHNILVQPRVIKCFVGPIRSDVWDLRVVSELLSELPYVGPFFEVVAKALGKAEDVFEYFLDEFVEALTVEQNVLDEFTEALAIMQDVRTDLQRISYRVETVLEPIFQDLSKINGYEEIFSPVSVRVLGASNSLFSPQGVLGPTLKGVGNVGVVIVSGLTSAFALDNFRANVCRLRDFFSKLRRFWEDFTSLIGFPLLERTLEHEIDLQDALFGGPVVRAAKNMCNSDVLVKNFCAPACKLIPGPLMDAAKEAKRVWKNAVEEWEDIRKDAEECIGDIVKCGKDTVERIGGGISSIFGGRRRLNEACEQSCADICSCAAGIGIGNTVGGPVGAAGGAVEAGCLGGFVKRATNEIQLRFTIRQVLEGIDRARNVIETAKNIADKFVQGEIAEAVMDLLRELIPDFELYISKIPDLKNGEALLQEKIRELIDLLNLPDDLTCLIGDDPFSCKVLDSLKEDIGIPLDSESESLPNITEKSAAVPTPSPTSAPSSLPTTVCVDGGRRQLRASFTDYTDLVLGTEDKRNLESPPPNKYGLESNPFCSYDFPYKLRIEPMRRQKCRTESVTNEACWYKSSNFAGGSGSGDSGTGSGDIDVPDFVPNALDGCWVETDGNLITTTNLTFDDDGIPIAGKMTFMSFGPLGFVLGTSRTLTDESSESIAAVAASAGDDGLVAFPTNSDQIVLYDVHTGVDSIVSITDNVEHFGRAVALHADASSVYLTTISRDVTGKSQSHTFQLRETGKGYWSALQVSTDEMPDGIASNEIIDSSGILGATGIPEFFYLARIRMDQDMLAFISPISDADLPNPPIVDPTNLAFSSGWGRVVVKPLLNGNWVHVEPIDGDDSCSALSLGPSLVVAACGWYFSRRVYVMPKISDGSLGVPEVLEPPGYVGKVTIKAEDLSTPDGINSLSALTFNTLSEWALAIALSPDERTIVLGYPVRISNIQDILDNPNGNISIKLDSQLHVFQRLEGASEWGHIAILKSSDFSLPSGTYSEKVYIGYDLAFADDSNTVFVTGIINDSSYTQFIRSFRVSDL